MATIQLEQKSPQVICNKAYKPDQRQIIAMLTEHEASMLFVTRHASRIKRVVTAMLNEQEAPK